MAMSIELVETGTENIESNDGDGAAEQREAAERIDAALRGSMDAEPGESPSPSEGAGGGDSQADPDSADEAEPGEGEGEGDAPDETVDKKKGNREGWRWKGLKQQQQRLAQQQAELSAGYQALAEQQAAAKQYQEAAERIRQLAVTSPRAAAREFARLTGQPAEDLYQGWTAERLQGGTEPEHDQQQQIPPAVKQLLDEQAQELKALKEGHEKFTSAAQQQQAAQIHADNCARVLAEAEAPDGKNTYACVYLATMPAALREASIAQAASMAAELQQADGVPREPGWVAKRLDDLRMSELRDQLSALPASALQAILPAGITVAKGRTAEGSASSAGGVSGRDSDSKKRGKRGIGNEAGAQSSTGARPGQSREEYERQLDERLRASLGD
jgi:hypothetical protein